MSQNMDFTIANVAGLRSFAVPADAGTTPTTANLQGYYTAGDRGGGCFDYSASSTATDDGFSTIEPSAGSGRWIRRIDAWNIDMRMAGAVANGISDDTSAHYAIMNWAGAGGGYSSTGGAIGNPIAVRIQYSAGQTIYFGSGGNVVFGASAAGYLSGSVFEGVDAGMVRPNQNNTFYPLDGIQLAPGTYIQLEDSVTLRNVAIVRKGLPLATSTSQAQAEVNSWQADGRSTGFNIVTTALVPQFIWGSSVGLSGSNIDASTTVTCASTASLLVGMVVYGGGFPIPTLIDTIVSTTQFTTTLPSINSATASGTTLVCYTPSIAILNIGARTIIEDCSITGFGIGLRSQGAGHIDNVQCDCGIMGFHFYNTFDDTHVSNIRVFPVYPSYVGGVTYHSAAVTVHATWSGGYNSQRKFRRR